MNFEIQKLLLLPLAFSFVISFLATPLTIILAKKFKVMDDPKKHKHPKVIHEYPVPRGGGIPIWLSLLTIFVFLPAGKHLMGIIAGATIALFVGLLDDRYEEKVSPLFRLLSNFLAAALVVGAGIGIAFITNPLTGGILRLDEPKIIFEFLGKTRSIWILSDILALFWISWCMNFVGWSAGVDGQLPGFVAISAVTIGLLSLRFTQDVTQWPVVILAATTAGAYLGFLPWNFYPQKIIPGYSGKSLAGFLLGVLSILSGAKLATALLVLGIPLIDAVFIVFKRISQKRSPFLGGHEHLHHRLLDLGWGKRRIAVFYWMMSGFLGFLALNLNSQQKFYTIILLPALFFVFIIWLNSLSTFLKPPGQGSG